MLALRARRLFDGVRPVPMSRPTVLLSGGVIEAVLDGPPPRGAELVDLGDTTLLPGLVDAHVHLAFDATPDTMGSLAVADDDTLLARMRTAATATLDAGVTTARDLGDRGYLGLRVRAETADAPHLGPRLLVAGPPITSYGGHCWFLGGEVDGVDAIRAAVRHRAERGVDVVKVVVTGGQLTPGSLPHEMQFGPVELAAVVRESHRYGLPVTGHCHAADGVAAAVSAGFDGIEHCTFVTADGVHADPALLARMAAAGTRITLTLGTVGHGGGGGGGDPRRAAVHAALRRVAGSGVPVACASDAGCGPGKPHGSSLAYGVEAMVDLGVPPTAALRAVTSGAAQVCGLADRVGRIAPGYDADLLAVHGDPTVEPGALRRVAAVLRAGQRVR
ncbi:amidohydrolase family protein [Micromonospora sp. NPDC047793]|uniref:amidohydrolase family protein n=1 Tax=unclassified Micromonospora TaxID=2617518 RepID=UPI001034EA0B|nr:amidohydrolase family protein [Verrucosispora sp. SN26_14.1]TBL26879.1 amidohydrolase family protein [Verrucosispora sp. SN26_14.1]